MARLTSKQRKAIPKSKFGVPSKAPGAGSYPMNNKTHARVAKSYAARFASPSQRAQIDAKANRILGRAARSADRKARSK